jgi:hypothetical protein
LAPSHTFAIALTVSQDFLLLSSTSGQTVNAGQQTGPYNLTLQPVGDSFNAAVTLSCSGLPALSQCSFAPSAPVTPGNSAASVVMTISTTANTISAAGNTFRFSFYAACLFVPGIVIGWRRRSRRPISFATIGFLALVLLLLTLPSCGGISTGGDHGGHLGTPSGTYAITVTGTSPGAAPDAGQQTQVGLVVN